MTSMMEKPQSKRAKSFNRFSGKQNHGEAAQRRGRAEQNDFVSKDWRKRWNERGPIAADKTYMKEAIQDGLHADLTSDELKFAEASEKIETESLENVKDFEDGRYRGEDDFDDEEAYIDYLYSRAAHIVDQLNELPRTADGESMSQAELDSIKDELEAELDSIKASIEIEEGELPRTSDFGLKTKREIKNAMAKRATLDHSYVEDDDVDDEVFDSHITIRNAPRK